MIMGNSGIGSTGIISTVGNVGSVGIVSGQGGAAWTPASLTNLLWWYNLYDLSTMWQDSAKTTLVSADGDPVGYIEDSSGNGHDVHQTTAGNRPIYRTSGGISWLEFDGATNNRWLQSVNTIDMTATNSITLCSGGTADVNATIMMIESSSNALTTNGAYLLYFNTGNQWKGGSRGTTAREISSAIIAAPNTRTLIFKSTIGSTYSLQTNGTLVSGALSTGTGNFGNHTLYIGRRAGTSFPFDGSVFTSFLCSDIKTGDDLTAIEAYLQTTTGVAPW